MKKRAFIFIGILLITLTACAALPQTPPAHPSEPAAAAPMPTETPGLNPKLALTCQTENCAAIETATPIPPLRFVLPTPGAEPVSAWRPPLYPVPLALSQYDHFYFARPIGADQVNWPLANYRYGGIFFSDNIIHTGVDIPADKGAPVMAAGSGTVVWSGWGFFSGLPGNLDDPYGISVVIEHDFGYQGQPLYTVYAHLDSSAVVAGQYLQLGQTLGTVGETGFSTGPHLHFEVRVGQNSYHHTRNPELWIAPPQGWGVLAGQVLKKNGEPIETFEFKVVSMDTGRTWTLRTYGKGAARSDDYYKENTALGDLPAGGYRIIIQPEEAPKADIYPVQVFAGRITFFRYQMGKGFSTDLPVSPAKVNVPYPIATPTATP